MGKTKFGGQVPRDDPMFAGGPQIFSRLVSTPTAQNTSLGTSGASRNLADSQPKQAPKDKLVQ